MGDFGVTDIGFKRKTIADIQESVKTNIQKELGIDIEQNQQSVISILTTTFIQELSKLWQVAEETYNSHYPTTASGISLDNVCLIAGIKRKPKRKTKIRVVIYGNNGTSVNVGDSVCLTNDIEEPEVIARKTFICTENKQLSEPINRNRNTYMGFYDDLSESQKLNFDSSNYEYCQEVEFECEVSGYNKVDANQNIYVNIYGAYEIGRIVSSVNGQDEETDEELRTRFLQTSDWISGTEFGNMYNELMRVDSVRAVLLRSEEGKIYVIVDFNERYSVTNNILTKDEQIANAIKLAIARNKTPGISVSSPEEYFTNNESIFLLDGKVSLGFYNDEYVGNVPIVVALPNYVRCKVKVKYINRKNDGGAEAEAENKEQIKNALIEIFDGLKIGDTVYSNDLYNELDKLGVDTRRIRNIDVLRRGCSKDDTNPPSLFLGDEDYVITNSEDNIFYTNYDSTFEQNFYELVENNVVVSHKRYEGGKWKCVIGWVYCDDGNVIRTAPFERPYLDAEDITFE